MRNRIHLKRRSGPTISPCGGGGHDAATVVRKLATTTVSVAMGARRPGDRLVPLVYRGGPRRCYKRSAAGRRRRRRRRQDVIMARKICGVKKHAHTQGLSSAVY